MDDETLRALAQKLVVASPFVMMRYITLPDNTTLDMETKLAFAKTLKRQDYAEMFSGIKQNIDTDFSDRILCADEEEISDLVEQLGLIITATYEDKPHAFAYKQALFNFAADILLSIESVADIEDLPIQHIGRLSTLAVAMNLTEGMETPDTH